MKLNGILVTMLLLASACNNTPVAEHNTLHESVDGQHPLPDGHTSETALDWQGTYTGTMPCADCEGIYTTIVLKEDKTFSKTAVYKKGNHVDTAVASGTFEWSTTGDRIILKDIPAPNQYKVGENRLFALDMEGNVIRGELADTYILEKL